MPLLEGPGGGPVLARPARDRPFVVATSRAAVSGSELRGVAEVRLDGRVALADLADDAGTCSNVVVAPAEIRRERTGSGGTVLETALAADRVAGAAVQWAPAPPGRPLTLELSFRLPDGAAPRERGDDGSPDDRSLEVDLPDSGALVVVVDPAPEGWRVEDGRALASVRAPAGGAATLLVAAGHDPDAARAALAALRHLRVVETRLEAAAVRSRDEELATSTGEADLDEGLEWAKARLRALEPGRVDPAALPWALLGAVAAGDRRTAGRLAGAADPADPLHRAALAWHSLWTGEPPAREDRETLDSTAAALVRHPPSGAEAVAWRAALAAWADVLEGPGGRSRAGALRAAATSLARAGGPPSGPSDGGVRLPVLGAPAPGGAGRPPGPPTGGVRRSGGPPGALPASLVAALFDVEDGPAYAPPGLLDGGPAEGALHAWACYAAGHAERGFALLRAHLAGALAGVPGAWRHADPAGAALPAASPGLLPAALLFGLLGARADAAFGRLRLAPTFPERWTDFLVRNVRVADAAVDLRYARRGGRHTFTLRQTRGRAPVNLVFEPRMAVRGGPEVRVDGAPAEVGTVEAGNRTGVRLQLPLDREREVEVHGAEVPGG